MKKTKEEVIELFKTGNFTIIYWDNEEPTIYEKHWDINEEYERDEYETMNKFEIDYSGWRSGYCPEIVGLLAHALGGKADSI